MKRRTTLRAPRAQRGLAALIVVMVLFFVVSLVAAYTNRNLIFEQRTSANQYRSTQSFETAQAGLQWAVAMLNGGRIDDACNATTDPTKTSFRERYLGFNASTGMLTANIRSSSSAAYGHFGLYAACVFNGSTWNCSCPSDDDPSPTLPTGAGVFPAFHIRFAHVFTGSGALPPGTVRVESIACPRFDRACLNHLNPRGDEGRAFVSALVSLHSALKTPPSAALTVRGDVNVGGAALRVVNGDPATGITLQVGGTVNGFDSPGAVRSNTNIELASAPGTPAYSSVSTSLGDPMLAGLTAVDGLLPTVGDRLFSTLLGVTPANYRSQPAVTVLDNCPCSAQQVRDAAAAFPMRPIWVAGDLAIDSAGDIGSASAPVMLVVEGDVTHATGGVTLYGVVYSRAASWSTAGSGTVRGAAIAENDFAGSGSATYVYDRGVLNHLRHRYGSFVVVPGSWKDYLPS
jgi:hypothetical protein